MLFQNYEGRFPEMTSQVKLGIYIKIINFLRLT